MAIAGLAPLIVAQAAGAWSAPATLSDAGHYAHDAAVAIGADGTAVVVWERWNGWDFDDARVEASVRTPGGTFGAESDLSSGGSSPMRPGVGVGDAGDALVAWRRLSGGSQRLEARRRPSGGSFATATELASGVGVPILAMNGAGTSLIGWKDVGSSSIATLRGTGAGTSFGGVQSVSGVGLLPNLGGVAVGSGGDAVAVWDRWTGSQRIAQVATRDVGQPAFGGPGTISAGGVVAFTPRVAVDDGGGAVAVWMRDQADGTSGIEAAIRPADGSFGAATRISTPGHDAYRADVAIASDGTALAVWPVHLPGGDQRIEVAVRPPGGVFGTPTAISDVGPLMDSPRVAVDDDGDAIVAWLAGNPARVEAAARPAGGTFGPARVVSQPGVLGGPVLDAAPGGEVVAAWTRSGDGTPPRAEAALTMLAPTLDASTPVFSGVGVGESEARVVVIDNTAGELPLVVEGLTITGANAADFSVDAPPGPIPPGGSAEVVVTFAPSAPGARSASLAIASNAAGPPVTVALDASALVRGVAADAGAIDLGARRIDAGASAPATVTLTSTGDAPVDLGVPAISGTDPDAFAVVAHTCAGAALAPGASCAVAVAFDPSSPGTRRAVLRIPSDAPGGPVEIALTGLGTPPPAPAPSSPGPAPTIPAAPPAPPSAPPAEDGRGTAAVRDAERALLAAGVARARVADFVAFLEARPPGESFALATAVARTLPRSPRAAAPVTAVRVRGLLPAARVVTIRSALRGLRLRDGRRVVLVRAPGRSRARVAAHVGLVRPGEVYRRGRGLPAPIRMRSLQRLHSVTPSSRRAARITAELRRRVSVRLLARAGNGPRARRIALGVLRDGPPRRVAFRTAGGARRFAVLTTRVGAAVALTRRAERRR